MMYMQDGIVLNTEMQGGMFGGLKRMIAGESFFLTTFTNKGDGKKEVSFAAPYPGKILPLDLATTGPMICQRDAFLCSSYGIQVTVTFTRKLGAGFFGGEGFILEKISGNGIGFIHAGGTIIEHKLDMGEKMNVDTGCLVAFQESVDYDIKSVGGIKSILFGGQGIFFAQLTGPGIVYLQTLPFSRLADRIIAASRYSLQGDIKNIGPDRG